jgi:hypothetical protein
MFTGAIGAIIILGPAAILGLRFGDQSVAAAIAALASVLNAIILLRVRRAQDHIHTDIDAVASDTERRGQQISELRSLSVERNRQLMTMERIADRFESLVPESRPGGRRDSDPPAEG